MPEPTLSSLSCLQRKNIIGFFKRFEPASTGLPGLDDVTIGIVRAPKTFSARFIPRED